MWAPWGQQPPYPPHQPIMFVPWSPNMETKPPPDQLKVYKKMKKWIDRYEATNKQKEDAKKKPEPPKQPVKWYSKPELSYLQTLCWLLAFGGPVALIGAIFLIHLWNIFIDNLATIHHW
jgi:hypothetical protein